MKAHVNGIDLAFLDQGQGMPIVFVHAFPLSKAMWNPQAEGLASAFRTITVDLRGHGESDAPLWYYSMEQFADDLVGLMDHLGLGRAVFVGLSMGGYILFALYRKHPDLIKALVLADTRAQPDTPEGRAGRFAMAQTVHREGLEAVAALMLPKLLCPASLKSRPDLVQTVTRLITANQVSGIAGDLMGMALRPDSTPLLEHIRCPTLVIVGEEDVATPPDDARLMVYQIPSARLQVIPSAGHLSNLEQPEAFTAAIQSFLKTL